MCSINKHVISSIICKANREEFVASPSNSEPFLYEVFLPKKLLQHEVAISVEVVTFGEYVVNFVKNKREFGVVTLKSGIIDKYYSGKGKYNMYKALFDGFEDDDGILKEFAISDANTQGISESDAARSSAELELEFFTIIGKCKDPLLDFFNFDTILNDVRGFLKRSLDGKEEDMNVYSSQGEDVTDGPRLPRDVTDGGGKLFSFLSRNNSKTKYTKSKFMKNELYAKAKIVFKIKTFNLF